MIEDLKERLTYIRKRQFDKEAKLKKICVTDRCYGMLKTIAETLEAYSEERGFKTCVTWPEVIEIALE